MSTCLVGAEGTLLAASVVQASVLTGAWLEDELGDVACVSRTGMFGQLSLTSLLGGRSLGGSEDVTRKKGQEPCEGPSRTQGTDFQYLIFYF